MACRAKELLSEKGELLDRLTNAAPDSAFGPDDQVGQSPRRLLLRACHGVCKVPLEQLCSLPGSGVCLSCRQRAPPRACWGTAAQWQIGAPQPGSSSALAGRSEDACCLAQASLRQQAGQKPRNNTRHLQDSAAAPAETEVRATSAPALSEHLCQPAGRPVGHRA